MYTYRKIRCAVLAGVITTGFIMPAFADTALPQPVHEGDATYISGGVGYDEQQALKATAQNYNLQITNADKAGQFTADTDLTIQGKNGRDLIQVENTGPLFYAKLPPGAYTIKATNDNRRMVRNVRILAKKPVDIHLVWQQS